MCTKLLVSETHFPYKMGKRLIPLLGLYLYILLLTYCPMVAISPDHPGFFIGVICSVLKLLKSMWGLVIPLYGLLVVSS